MTVEKHLQAWMRDNPTAGVTLAERRFIEDMRRARAAGVGFGWMQVVIELEWNATCPPAWGPEWFSRQEQRAVAEEREACAAIADEQEQGRQTIARDIRARG